MRMIVKIKWLKKTLKDEVTTYKESYTLLFSDSIIETPK